MPVNPEFEPHQRLLFFRTAINFTLISQYWLVPGKDLSMDNISKKCLFHNQAKIKDCKLNFCSNYVNSSIGTTIRTVCIEEDVFLSNVIITNIITIYIYKCLSIMFYIIMFILIVNY